LDIMQLVVESGKRQRRGKERKGKESCGDV
jgi:hypothetical protein